MYLYFFLLSFFILSFYFIIYNKLLITLYTPVFFYNFVKNNQLQIIFNNKKTFKSTNTIKSEEEMNYFLDNCIN